MKSKEQILRSRAWWSVMKRIFAVWFVTVALSCVPDLSCAMDVRYPKPESEGDTRYTYHIALLRQACEKTADKYGKVNIIPADKTMNELRMVKLLMEGSFDIDVVFKPTSKDLESRLNPVRIPLDKGLLGWRIFLIKKENQPKFSSVRTIDQFKKLSVGQARGWGDIAIYEHNGIKVAKGPDFESMFSMLLSDRFDYFARGVEEAPRELEARREKMPELHIEESIVLHYPFVRYMWVANSPKGDMLRARITKGLEIMIRDGSFEKAFIRFKEDILKKVNMTGRRVFELENPFLPDTVDLNRTELWYKPLYP